MRQITVPNNFIPRAYQLPLFRAMDSGKKRAWLRWHRRAGKDKACWAYMCKEAARVPANYFYIFPTGTMARRALWENIDKDGFKTIVQYGEHEFNLSKELAVLKQKVEE